MGAKGVITTEERNGVFYVRFRKLQYPQNDCYGSDHSAIRYTDSIFWGVVIAVAVEQLISTSTMSDTSASTKFYLRIAQILFTGLFVVAGLILVERLLRPGVCSDGQGPTRPNQRNPIPEYHRNTT